MFISRRAKAIALEAVKQWTPEDRAYFDRMMHDLKVPEDGLCPDDGGRVIAYVQTWHQGWCHTGTAHCEVCKREFLFGKSNATILGQEEFERGLREPTTC
jgi:hypothetical protein